MTCFDERDLPGTYHDADWASLNAQRLYLGSFRGMLIATVSTALFSWLGSVLSKEQQLFNSIALILAVAAFVTTFVLKERKFEDTWYLGRAVAESIKTRAWRYMMNAEPYGADLSIEDVDFALVKDIRAILTDNAGLTLERAPNASREEISTNLKRLRLATFDERIEVYLQCRLIDQRDWYGKKASQHSRSETHIFIAVLLCQFVASGVALFGIVKSSLLAGSAALFAALGAAFLAWLQVKKYQETAQAYCVASHELGLAAALIKHVKTETELSLFIGESESAISREHTLWMARRTSRR